MKNWTGTTVQQESLKVPCSWCHSPAGTLCVGFDKKPLEAFPAHTCRSAAAKAAVAAERT
jgi:hypothetical protein